MAADPYETLGVKKNATAAQIRSAYLKLAKKHHPDLNPGDKKAEERFKSISSAHDLLSDTEKRARFGPATAITRKAARARATVPGPTAPTAPRFMIYSPIYSETARRPAWAHRGGTRACAAATSATGYPWASSRRWPGQPAA
jgi:curved DNA-binding protein CbpA